MWKALTAAVMLLTADTTATPPHYMVTVQCRDGDSWTAIDTDPEVIVDYVLVTSGKISGSQFAAEMKRKNRTDVHRAACFSPSV